MNDEIEIYLRDLTPQAQKKVLAFLGIKAAEKSNLDVFPFSYCPNKKGGLSNKDYFFSFHALVYKRTKSLSIKNGS